ncbi:protein SERAC1-like [Littorina saxatilis]|uniref:Protein SERAC1 n=1 Tax=Littorina saxatilis TaxID=31220 RepID=A0AAN9GCS4_9CAEN
MWFCQRLFTNGCCSRLVIRSSKLIGRPDGIPSTDSTPCKWHCCKLRTLGLKVIRFSHSSGQSRDSHQQRSAFFSSLTWGVVAVFVTTFVSTIIVWWEIKLLHRNMSDVTSAFSNAESLQSANSAPLHMSQLPGDSQGHTDSGDVWFPWIQAKSKDPFTLLELCCTENPIVRRLGVKALAQKTHWEDYQYRYVAQAADFRTLIGLSRSQGADPRYFLQPPSLVPTETHLLNELAAMVLALDVEVKDSKGRSPNGSVTAIAQQYLQNRYRATDDKIHFWGFDGSSLDVASLDGPPPEDQLLLEFLTALAQLCCTAELAALFVEKKGLVMLQRAVEQYENTLTFTAVADLLGNLALHTSLHEVMVKTGWLGTLKSWSEGKNSTLAVMAARVLTNMDRDWSTEVLDDGIVVLHPLWRSGKTVHADVIFVHGFLGGAVKTWRQQDKVIKSQQNHDGTPHTDCWPKDWLAEDCPHIRILSVHYNTALSFWLANNGINKEKCTLEGRSREILEKLTKAGVGARPIIWVGHSMGGLLIKQMLEQCSGEEHKAKRKQTCGFLLYSVPHRGLTIAGLTSQVHYLLYPSPEVRELSPGSPHLDRLHEHFRCFVDTNSIPCLSFGEQLKTQFRKTLPRLLLVPPESSDPGVGEFCSLPRDHINICKPESRNSTVYERSLAFVHRCIFFSYMHRIRQVVSDSLD